MTAIKHQSQSHFPMMRQRRVSGFDDILGLVTDPDRDWQDQAVCAETDPDAFFPEKGGSTKEAKKICLGCDVKDECLKYALDHDERFGIWGGYSERERRRLQRGETITPTTRHGGHQPSYACYQRGCKTPECYQARLAYERDLRARKKQQLTGGAA